jgi:hypothetical protein
MKDKFTLPALLFLCLVLGCKKDSTPSTPPVSGDVHLKTGLLLYLPFDGNIADSSGNGNTTTSVNDPVLGYDEHGYSNSAFTSTGFGEEILVTNNGSIKFDSAFTLSFNFTTTSAGPQSFISFVNWQTGFGPTFNLGTTLINNHAFDVSVSDSTAGCDNSGYGNPNQIFDTTNFVPQIGSWYNAVCIYHKGTLQIYINGKLISTKTGTGHIALLCPSAQFVVGGWWNSDKQSMTGKLDEIRMYNRVLNADEIAELAKDFQQN